MGPDCDEEHRKFMNNPYCWIEENPDLFYTLDAEIFQKAKKIRGERSLEETKSDT